MRISEAAGMSAPFDHVALNYDSSFTKTKTGRLQRDQVWTYLDRALSELHGRNILELNGGTGEDAVYLATKGFDVLTTDVSSQMLRTIESKITQHALAEKIKTSILDLNNFKPDSFDKKFDLVFSNFGGMNCLAPTALQQLITRLPEVLSPGGRFIAVIMPRFCLWESLYFAAKFRFSKAARRWTSDSVTASLGGSTVETWYYSPAMIKSWADATFQVVTAQPIGMALPPSYLNSFFEHREKFLTRLTRLEKKLAGNSFLSGMSDHFLIDLRLR